MLSESTQRTYAAAWALFSDWCAVTGHPDLPANPATVTAFLADCPAALKTHRGWVAAIDHRHITAGHPPPGRSAPVLVALGRPTGQPRQFPAETCDRGTTTWRLNRRRRWCHGPSSAGGTRNGRGIGGGPTLRSGVVSRTS